MLGVPLADLADWSGPWSDFPAATTISTEADTPGHLALRVEQQLVDRLSAVTPVGRRHATLAQSVAVSRLGVNELAIKFGVSRQHLNRSVRLVTGVSAKALSRIGRLKRVVRELETTPAAQAACAAGYYDQAHLVNEFRALTGATPDTYLATRTTS